MWGNAGNPFADRLMSAVVLTAVLSCLNSELRFPRLPEAVSYWRVRGRIR